MTKTPRSRFVPQVHNRAGDAIGAITSRIDVGVTIRNSTLVANQALGGDGGHGREPPSPSLDNAGERRLAAAFVVSSTPA